MFVGEAPEPLSFAPLVAIRGILAADEVVQVGARESVGLQREVLVSAEIVDPERARPGRFAGRLAVEEKHVGFDALGVEDAGWQPQQGMDVAIVEEAFANGLAGAALEQDIVGQDDGCAAVDLEQAADVLEEVELLVAGGGPEVVTQNFLALLHLVAVPIDNRDAGLLTEWRIGEHHVVVGGWLGGEAVFAGLDVLFVPEVVQEQVHGAETRGSRYEFDGVECLGLKVAYLVAIELVVLEDVGGRREEKTTGAGGGIDDGGLRLRAHDGDDGVDQDARSEVLARA